MLELLHIHFSFLCRSWRSNKKKQSPIVLRVVYREERRDIYTGLYCNIKDWDADAGMVSLNCKQAETINKNLELINYQALQVFDQLKFSRTPFTIDELVEKLKGKETRPVLLVEYLQSRTKELSKKTGLDFTPATYEKYERCSRFVIDFMEQEFKVKNYSLVRIDSKFLELYFQYLRTARNIGNNTAVKYMAFFKTLLMPAIKSRIIRHDPFTDTKFRIKTIPKGFLTDEEIEILINVNLDSDDLDRIRDQYLLCCYTGLAYGDLKQLSRQHFIQQKQEGFYILKPRQKTGQDCIIPLLPVAQSILQKYSPTKDFRDFQWYVSANQKMNQRLKTIGEKAELSKILHMHLARHTFATTITLSKGVPIESVSSMLGHATLRQTQHYAKIVATKVINDMAKIKELYK
jgi:site-specific recombinase XerD